MPYRVLVDDHFHYQDESHRYEAGVYQTCGEAIHKCQEIVDRELLHLAKPGMSADELFSMSSLFGEDPFILPTMPGEQPVGFPSWDYAKGKSKLIAADRSRATTHDSPKD